MKLSKIGPKEKSNVTWALLPLTLADLALINNQPPEDADSATWIEETQASREWCGKADSVLFPTLRLLDWRSASWCTLVRYRAGQVFGHPAPGQRSVRAERAKREPGSQTLPRWRRDDAKFIPGSPVSQSTFWSKLAVSGYQSCLSADCLRHGQAGRGSRLPPISKIESDLLGSAAARAEADAARTEGAESVPHVQYPREERYAYIYFARCWRGFEFLLRRRPSLGDRAVLVRASSDQYRLVRASTFISRD